MGLQRRSCAPGHWSTTAREEVQDRRDRGRVRADAFGAAGRHCSGTWLLGEEGRIRAAASPGHRGQERFRCRPPLTLTALAASIPLPAGPQLFNSIPAPRIIYHAVVTAFKLCSAGGKARWLNEQQKQHPSSQECLGCHSQTCPTTSSAGIPPPTTQHHQQPNQEPQHGLEAVLIGQAGWQPQRGSQRQHRSLSCTLQPRQAGGRRGCRSPSPRWQLPELSITAMGLGYRRDGTQEGWEAAPPNPPPHQRQGDY